MGTRVKERSLTHGHSYDARPTRLRYFWLGLGVVGLASLFTLRAIIGGSELALPNQLQDLLTLSISVIIESLPFVILGILLSIVVQLWLPDGILMRYLPRNPVLARHRQHCGLAIQHACESGCPAYAEL